VYCTVIWQSKLSIGGAVRDFVKMGDRLIRHQALTKSVGGLVGYDEHLGDVDAASEGGVRDFVSLDAAVRFEPLLYKEMEVVFTAIRVGDIDKKAASIALVDFGGVVGTRPNGG